MHLTQNGRQPESGEWIEKKDRPTRLVMIVGLIWTLMEKKKTNMYLYNPSSMYSPLALKSAFA